MQRMILACAALAGCLTILPTSHANPEPLIGGLLGGGGGDGGLLGSVLGENGLLASVACLLGELGLDVVAELLLSLTKSDAMSLEELCLESNNPASGGGGLFGALLSGGLINGNAIPTVLCLVKGVGLQEVNHLINEAGAEKFFKIKDIVCPDGQPLIAAGSKGSSILTQLIEKSGLDLDETLRQITCVVKDFKLEALLDALDKLGVDTKFGLDERFCEDMKSILG